MVVPLHRVNFWDDLGQFNSALVNLLCPLHNPFGDTSVSDANQTNPLEEKRCKFTLKLLDRIEILQVSRAMMLIYARVPHCGLRTIN